MIIKERRTPSLWTNRLKFLWVRQVCWVITTTVFEVASICIIMLSPFGLSTEPTVSRDPPVSDEGRHQLLANATKNKFPKIVDVDYPTTGEGLKTKFKNKKETAGFFENGEVFGVITWTAFDLGFTGLFEMPSRSTRSITRNRRRNLSNQNLSLSSSSWVDSSPFLLKDRF